jgi:hypothetical protein
MHFHDGNVTSIELQGDRKVVIGLIDENGERWSLSLSGVDRMRAMDFMDGNIVLEVIQLSQQEPPLEPLRKLYGLGQDEFPDFLASKVGSIRTGEAILVHIVPSYGCELIALCEKTGLEKISGG